MKTLDEVFAVTRYYIHDSTTVDKCLRDRCLGYVRNRDFKSLASVSGSLDAQLNVHNARFARQIEALFKKNSIFTDEAFALNSARETFTRNEKKCERTNKRLDFYDQYRDRIDPDILAQISRSKSYIRRILGPLQDSTSDKKSFLDKIPDLVRVTSGATSTHGRKDSLPHKKLLRTGFCTPGALPYIRALQSYWGYPKLKAKLTRQNRVEVVPKSWKTHRTIACEPVWNIPLQLAFDSYAKDRLRRYGIDLSDQERNQNLARIGSIDNSLATIDLSAASDTVAYNTVAWLFPQPWFQFLDQLRSSFYKGPFGEGKYAKFSSMGNGSTFAIETLIFASFCKAVGSKRFSVYGDDIIIESELTEPLTKLLSFFGFSINAEKSFSDGSFRESCGADWFDGVNITPVYLRAVDSRKAVLSHNVNLLASIAVPGGKLAEELKNICLSNQLQFVPWNGVSTSGVWIDTHSAYQAKLIKKAKGRPGLYVYRRYIVIDKTAVCRDSRALFLWYLDVRGRSKSVQDLLCEHRNTKLPDWERSKVSRLKHKYVRKWGNWTSCPATATPIHLYWWSEFAIRNS